MARPIRFYVRCKFTGKNGKDVNVNKILLVSPKLNERERLRNVLRIGLRPTSKKVIQILELLTSNL